MVEANAARRASLRFSWRTAPSGTKWLRLTRGEAVNVYFWKARRCWTYFTDADGKETYRNGFETELEAMLAAEEDLGDRVVVDERQQPARKPTPNLTVVKAKVKPEPEVIPQQQVEVEPEEPAQTPSAKRSPEEYIKAICAQDPTPWGRVLQHACGGMKPIQTVALRSGLSDEETLRFLKSYDPDMVEIEIKNNEVSLALTEKAYADAPASE